MPANDKLDSDERDSDNEQTHKSKSSKSKDLSHVPCKFFKVGACTAGSSCPFSHTVHEPGQQKGVCAWFVKGNCKFGHKCALAHLAAVGGVPSPGRESRTSRGPKKDGHKSALPHGPSSSGSGLLSGSTAPTRTTSARPPMAMTLKATPSAPAPPVKDTDFPPFVLPDDADTHKPIHVPLTPATASAHSEDDAPSEPPPDASPVHHRNPSPPTLPLNVPGAPRRPVLPADAADLGPIGSPPRGSLSAHSPISSGDSPQNAGIPSTFHAHTSLLTESRNRLGPAAGVPSSLGHTHSQAWKSDLASVPAHAPPGIDVSISGDRDVLSADEDLEEFLPSSLTDLLTPSERSRRMSRTHSGSSRPAHLGDTPPPFPPVHPLASQTQSHHRHSRSVPAPSLLGDVKSIWAERGLTANGAPPSPDKPSFGVPPIGSGTPSSLKSSNGLGARNLGGTITPSGPGTGVFREDAHSPSSSLLAPSNASAAFLPGLHHYYSKTNSGSNNGRNPSAGLTLGTGLGIGGLSRSPLSHTPIHGPAADEVLTSTNNGPTVGLGLGEATSPSFRALQSHAPGQSLPQGLAAGYSRIHALPLTGSPSSLGGSSVGGGGGGGGAFSPGHGPVPFGINAGPGQPDWHLQSNHFLSTDAVSHLSLSARYDLAAGANPAVSGAPSTAALESMFSRLPLGAGAPLRTPTHPANNNRNWHVQNIHSPLSRPISDDEELFIMDG
ncbi:hypothetical protein HD554DRAFT_2170931 [Boletus coccyginus]|nr:hypothetical protein HD554DRAFT_2170931 [Boletus coccyginus]